MIPGLKEDKQLGDGAMLMRLERMNRGDITVHGFRSAFKDWALECTDFAPEVSEMALAHVVEDKVEAAYRRGDLLRKRRALMQMWARYVEGKGKQPEAQAEGNMRQVPTERNRAIAQRRAEGHTFAAVEARFALMPDGVNEICHRVEDYDQGAASHATH